MMMMMMMMIFRDHQKLTQKSLPYPKR